MFNPKRAVLIAVAATLIPGAVLANTDECPSMTDVLDVVKPEGQGAEIDQARLVEEVGKSSGSPAAIRALGNELKNELPDNPESVIADLMITAYCEFLSTSESDVALDASVQDYEKVLYDEVFANPGGTVSEENSRPEGWLWGN
ncbi:MAG: hypothetical protein AAGF74_02260 [Pseudomonadota bacterium]